MSYQSPIEVIYNDIEYHFEDAVFKAIQKVDIKVDRNELIKALEYDRAQYDKGYADGRADTLNDLMRCGECKFFRPYSHTYNCVLHISTVCEDGFCSYGERKEDG